MSSDDDKYTHKPRKVPTGRLSRLASFGGLAGSIAANVVKDAGKQLLSGSKPSLSRSVLSSDNARSITNKLANMRGAAMKVGQLLSMDAGDILPEQWEPILSRLRQQADPMPKSQLLSALKSAWGDDWFAKFSYFSFEPIAAASIGQVHKATLSDGTQLAIKVQYPGVKQSINSDIDNVVSLIKLSGALPKQIDLTPLLTKAKQQLHEEADYLLEAQHMRVYAEKIAHLTHFEVPCVYQPLTTDTVLCMTYVEGQALESMTKQGDIDFVVNALFELTLDEIFNFRMTQSDPNFANFLYDASRHASNPKAIKAIKLLDFGATRKISATLSASYLAMANAMQSQDRRNIKAALFDLNLIDTRMSDSTIDVILEACWLAAECLQTQTYNFKQSNLIQRIQSITMPLIQNKDATATPDFDVALINRKVTGIVLLANRLGANVKLQSILNKAICTVQPKEE